MSAHRVKFHRIVKSQFGEIGIVWSGETKDAKILEILLPRPRKHMANVIKKVYPNALLKGSRLIDDVCKKFGKFLKGNPIDFSVDNLDLARLYDFQRRVLLLEKQVPYGRVSTYGRLAEKIGHPGAARAIGTALARNPFPLIIPCHRIIRKDGSLGGFTGGLRLKRQLLELEGVKFDSKARVINAVLW